MNKIHETSGKFCVECKDIVSFYDQGLACDCGPSWETEVIDEEDYPDKWIDVTIKVYEASHER